MTAARILALKQQLTCGQPADGRRESYRQTKKSHDGVDETVVDQKKTCMNSDIFTIYWQNSIWKTPKAIQISWWLPTDDTWLVQTDGWKSDTLFAETDPIYVRVTWCWIWTGYDISLPSQWEYIYMHAIMQYSSNLSRQKHNLKMYSGSVQSNHWRIQEQSADIPKF